MKRRIRNHGEQGSATMEFVIGLPLLVVAMIFIFEFSSLFWAHHIATYNVREAIRYLARSPAAACGTYAAAPNATYKTNAENIARYGDPAADEGSYDWMEDMEIVISPEDDTCDQDTFTATDFRVAGRTIKIHANVPFSMPLMGSMNTFTGGDTDNTLTFSIIEEARYIGE